MTHFVRDLRTMDDIAHGIHPTVPDLYILLTALSRIANGSRFVSKGCFQISAPALGLPDPQKHFGKQGIGLGVLIQVLGNVCIPTEEQAELLFE